MERCGVDFSLSIWIDRWRVALLRVPLEVNVTLNIFLSFLVHSSYPLGARKARAG